MTCIGLKIHFLITRKMTSPQFKSIVTSILSLYAINHILRNLIMELDGHIL